MQRLTPRYLIDIDRSPQPFMANFQSPGGSPGAWHNGIGYYYNLDYAATKEAIISKSGGLELDRVISPWIMRQESV